MRARLTKQMADEQSVIDRVARAMWAEQESQFDPRHRIKYEDRQGNGIVALAVVAVRAVRECDGWIELTG